LSGHVDSAIVVAAPLAFTWDVLFARDVAGDNGRHDVVSFDSRGSRIILRVHSQPDHAVHRWTYLVERCYDPLHRTVYARRYGSDRWHYSNAWWSYEAVRGGTRIRCVQDFETTPDAGMSDPELEDLVLQQTDDSLRDAKAFVEAQLAARHG
jgi:aromatase